MARVANVRARTHRRAKAPRSSLLDAHTPLLTRAHMSSPALSVTLPTAPVPSRRPLSPPSATPFPSAPYCQEIFVTESRVVSLGEQATPKVSRLSGPAAPSIRATIIGQLKPGESVRVTCHPIIIRCPRGGSTTYPRDRARVAVTTNSGNTVARGGGVRARERAKGQRQGGERERLVESMAGGGGQGEREGGELDRGAGGKASPRRAKRRA